MVNKDIEDSLKRYVDNRILPGEFLTAVLENNLMEALGRADSWNRQKLFEIVQYVYNDLPSKCWGSADKVKAWVDTE